MLSSVRALIRAGDPNFRVNASSWPSFVFPRGQWDPDDEEKGLFMSKILVKVSSSHGVDVSVLLNWCQVRYV